MSRQTTRLMVLGVVAYRQPVSGYGIQKTLDEWAVSRWTTIAPASIYQQLRTLAGHGFIESVHDATGRTAEYRCTTVGDAGFHTLLLDLLNEQDFQPMSLIPLLHFTPSLSVEELDAGLAARVMAIDKVLAVEDQLLANAAALGPAHVMEIFRLNGHGLRADQSWCREFRHRLTERPL